MRSRQYRLAKRNSPRPPTAGLIRSNLHGNSFDADPLNVEKRIELLEGTFGAMLTEKMQRLGPG